MSAMLSVFGLILLVGVLGLVLPGLIARDAESVEDLGYTLHQPEPIAPPRRWAVAVLVRLDGYDPDCWDRPPVNMLLIWAGAWPEYQCLHCSRYLWTESGAKFHILMEHQA